MRFEAILFSRDSDDVAQTPIKIRITSMCTLDCAHRARHIIQELTSMARRKLTNRRLFNRFIHIETDGAEMVLFEEFELEASGRTKIRASA